MRIQIIYTLCTDGDFDLHDPDKYGCIETDVTTIDDDHYDYMGTITFINDNPEVCKLHAINLLNSLLCDGLKMSDSQITNYRFKWLCHKFTKIISHMTYYISIHESGSKILKGTIGGNYDGTEIMVIITD